MTDSVPCIFSFFNLEEVFSRESMGKAYIIYFALQEHISSIPKMIRIRWIFYLITLLHYLILLMNFLTIIFKVPLWIYEL
jgi:hypothetical protein